MARTASSPRGARLAPAARRGAIVAAATRIALAEGLESVTLRRVAASLGVVPGLVNHYFPAADALVAEAFGQAAARERDALFARRGEAPTPLDFLRVLLAGLVSEEADEISLLWLDAWQAARRRAALRLEVEVQMSAWRQALASLIADGVAAGQFTTDDPAASATRIIALVDGLSVQAAIRPALAYETVRRMVVSLAERELGLAPGALAS